MAEGFCSAGFFCFALYCFRSPHIVLRLVTATVSFYGHSSEFQSSFVRFDGETARAFFFRWDTRPPNESGSEMRNDSAPEQQQFCV